jgi:hypothetical protein
MFTKGIVLQCSMAYLGSLPCHYRLLYRWKGLCRRESKSCYAHVPELRAQQFPIQEVDLHRSGYIYGNCFTVVLG